MSAKEFSLDISAFIEKTTKNVDAKVRKICLDLFSGITMETPVDQGRAINNWFPSIGTPSNQTTTSLDPSGKASIARAQAVVKNAPGNVFWISNNLPYIYRLEFGGYPPGPKIVAGYSKKAARGMVRITIDRIQRELR